MCINQATSLAVAFLGQVIDWRGGSDIAYFGLAVGLVTNRADLFHKRQGREGQEGATRRQ